MSAAHGAGLPAIRALGPGDGAVLGAATRLFRGSPALRPEEFLADPGTVAFVAGTGPEVVGWVWGVRQRHVLGHTQLQLYEVEVVPAFRGRGLGRALVGAMLDLARREGHRRMWLFTDTDNLPAIRLYEAAGGVPSPHDDAGYWWQLPAG